MGGNYNGNTVFYKKAVDSTLTLKDVFSDVFKKHAKQDGERLFVAGTSTTTPNESEMLSGWTKPWLFIRILGIGFGILLLLYILVAQGYGLLASSPFAFIGSFIVPLAVLLFYWEMNIPRNIPLYQVLLVLLVGGVISLIITGLLNSVLSMDNLPVYFAPFVEEPAKLAAAFIFLKKFNKNYILNGILIGGAVGAGFAAIESSGYYLQNGMDTMILRAFDAPGGHVLWAAMYCGMLIAVKGKEDLQFSHLLKTDFLKYFGAAVLLHFIWNTPFSIFSVPFFGDIKFVILIVIGWFILLSVIKKGISQVVNVTAGNQAGAAAGQPAQAQSQMMLCGMTGMYAGQSVPLSAGRLVFGREPSICNIIFPPATQGISRQHCTVTFDGRTVFVCDDNSSNGTFINGQRLAPGAQTPLYPGQQFWLGNKDVMFELRS